MRGTRGRLLALTVTVVTAASAFYPATAAQRWRGDATAEPLGTTATVRALDDHFRPRTVTISHGSSVRWSNRGDNTHTTTGGTWSASLSPGESYTKRFRRAGTYPYSCLLHSGMTGRVIVT
jgi:plastocyanin